MRHITKNVIENVADHGSERSAGGLEYWRVGNFITPVPHHSFTPFRGQMRVEVKLRKLRVVVEHFFEMRHEPFGIHRIARESATELIVNAAGGHALASMQNHPDRLRIVKTSGATQQKQRNARLGKLRRAAESAVAGIVNRLENRGRVAQHVCGQQKIGQGGTGGCRREPGMNFGGGIREFTAVFAPEPGDLPEQLQKTGPALTAIRREISAAEKRLQ